MKNKAFEFRIYPNKEQRILLAKTFGCTRLVYNYFLALRKEIYDESGCIHLEVKDLSVKEWFCDWCLTYHDRDRNAAINIKHKGMRQLSA